MDCMCSFHNKEVHRKKCYQYFRSTPKKLIQTLRPHTDLLICHLLTSAADTSSYTPSSLHLWSKKRYIQYLQKNSWFLNMHFREQKNLVPYKQRSEKPQGFFFLPKHSTFFSWWAITHTQTFPMLERWEPHKKTPARTASSVTLCIPAQGEASCWVRKGILGVIWARGVSFYPFPLSLI